MSIEGRWGYTHDEETYHGSYATPEEAARESGRVVATVGQYEAPTPPEAYIDASLLVDHVLCQDDYCGDWADGCLDASPAEMAELTDAVRSAFRAWIDKNGLEPQFGTVRLDSVRKIKITDL